MSSIASSGWERDLNMAEAEPAYRMSHTYKHDQFEEFLEDVEPRAGDLLQFQRNGYKHWAVYIGERDGHHWVIHFTNIHVLHSEAVSRLLTATESENNTAKVYEETLETVWGQDTCCLNNFSDTMWKPLSADQIVSSAIAAKTNNYNKPYDVMTNNCEHFVHRCRYGVAYSGQASRGTSAATILGVGLTVSAGIALGPISALFVGGCSAAAAVIFINKRFNSCQKVVACAQASKQSVTVLAEIVSKSPLVRKILVEVMKNVAGHLLSKGLVDMGKYRLFIDICEPLINSTVLQQPTLRLVAVVIDLALNAYLKRVETDQEPELHDSDQTPDYENQNLSCFEVIADTVMVNVVESVFEALINDNHLEMFLKDLVGKAGEYFELSKEQLNALCISAEIGKSDLKRCLMLLVNEIINQTVSSPELQKGLIMAFKDIKI